MERTIYGETHIDPETTNHERKCSNCSIRAALKLQMITISKAICFASDRQLAEEYKAPWTGTSRYLGRINLHQYHQFDALNRPTEMTAPDNSRIRRYYNASNLLCQIDGRIYGETPVTSFITNLQYNAKAQLTRVDYGNAVTTTYCYEPLTFQLVELKTSRNPRIFPDDCKRPSPIGWPGCQIQNLRYTYDPVRNVTTFKTKHNRPFFFVTIGSILATSTLTIPFTG